MSKNLKVFLMFLAAIISTGVLVARSGNGAGVDDKINAAMEPVSNAAVSVIFYSVEFLGQSIPLVLLWLVAASCFFTIYFGFINFRYFKYAIQLLFEKTPSDKKDKKGEINRFQALSTSVSGTVGLGNIGGVAVAISLGGPGAMIWMIVMGLIGMTTKFVEISTAIKYRHRTEEGHFSGGPMYYLTEGFKERGMPKLGWCLGAFFSLCCIGGAFGGGNMFQVNQSFQQFVNVTGGPDASFIADKGWLFGLFVSTMVAAVIIGGIKSIAAVASRIVPFMAALYFFGAMGVIIVNAAHIPEAVVVIFKGAFGLDAVAGGFLGGLIAAMLQGVRRAAFSNEAGLGSASIAHSAVKTDHHVSQGFVAMLEPFIDTVIICSLTALVIVVSGVYTDNTGMAGVELTSKAFAETFTWFPYILALAVFLFAFSSMIAWSYYGLKAFTFLFGESEKVETTYKVMYCMVTVIGGALSLGKIIDFMDAAIFAMTIPNIIGLYVMAPKLKKELKEYISERIK
jgi:AGCS family alanine or glycine:cation symporter